MAEQTEKQETKGTKAKKTDKTTRKSYNQLSKNQVLEIIDTMADKTPKQIAQKYKTSVSHITSLFRLFNHTQWRQKTEDDTTPQGFMFPKNLPQIVKSTMWDRGYVDSEDDNK